MEAYYLKIDNRVKWYKNLSLTLAVIFAAVGFMFLFTPDTTLNFFNRISGYVGFQEAPVQGVDFYLILATAYMYFVTLLAFMMYRYPEQNSYPFLLANAKLASSVISIYLFLMHQPYLIYLANFAVDGLIGFGVLYLMKMKKTGVEVR